MTLNTTRSTLDYIFSIRAPKIPKFHRFCSMASHFQAVGHFEPTAPNDLKMTKHYKVKGTPYVLISNYR